MLQKDKNYQTKDVNYLATIADVMGGLVFVLLIFLWFFGEQLNLFSKDKSELVDSIKTLREENEKLKNNNEEIKELRQKELQDKQKEIDELKSQQDAYKKIVENNEEEIRKRVQELFENSDKSRKNLLDQIKLELKSQSPPIEVEVDEHAGVLRLSQDSITFKTGGSDLPVEMRNKVEKIKDVLSKTLECYTDNQKENCKKINPEGHTLDAIFVEGHTDNQPFGDDTSGKFNRRLATDRANTVYEILMGKSSNLRMLKNQKGQLLFSLSGYGEDRPVKGHEHTVPTDDKVNRRIEIRFVMSAPTKNLQTKGSKDSNEQD